MTQLKSVVIRGYEESDNRSLLALLETVFGVERSVALWKWRFELNPYQVELGHRQIFATLGVDPASHDAVVAQYAVTPTYVNQAGVRTLACQSGDTAVHPDYQGYGLFVKTAAENYQTLASAGFTLVYGFPNLNSFPGFVRRLSWDRVFQLYEYSLRLRAGAVSLKPFVRIRRTEQSIRLDRQFRGRTIDFRVDADVPPDFDALWKDVSGFEILSIWKDREYLSWRYAKHPTQSYQFVSLREHGRLVALAVATKAGGDLLITELFSAKKDIALGRLLVHRIVSSPLAAGVRSIRFTGRDDVFFDGVFAGFERHASQLVFCLRVFANDERASRALLPNNWTVTVGDLDYL